MYHLRNISFLLIFIIILSSAILKFTLNIRKPNPPKIFLHSYGNQIAQSTLPATPTNFNLHPFITSRNLRARSPFPPTLKHKKHCAPANAPGCAAATCLAYISISRRLHTHTRSRSEDRSCACIYKCVPGFLLRSRGRLLSRVYPSPDERAHTHTCIVHS